MLASTFHNKHWRKLGYYNIANALAPGRDYKPANETQSYQRCTELAELIPAVRSRSAMKKISSTTIGSLGSTCIMYNNACIKSYRRILCQCGLSARSRLQPALWIAKARPTLACFTPARNCAKHDSGRGQTPIGRNPPPSPILRGA